MACAQDGMLIVEAVFGRLEAMPPTGTVAAAAAGTAAGVTPVSAAQTDAGAENVSADARPSPQPHVHCLDSGARHSSIEATALAS